jgi:hypothetical protein
MKMLDKVAESEKIGYDESMIKFKRHFKSNIEKLRIAESEIKIGPKFANCFIDMTVHLGMELDKIEMKSRPEIVTGP